MHLLVLIHRRVQSYLNKFGGQESSSHLTMADLLQVKPIFSSNFTVSCEGTEDAASDMQCAPASVRNLPEQRGGRTPQTLVA